MKLPRLRLPSQARRRLSVVPGLAEPAPQGRQFHINPLVAGAAGLSGEQPAVVVADDERERLTNAVQSTAVAHRHDPAVAEVGVEEAHEHPLRRNLPSTAIRAMEYG